MKRNDRNSRALDLHTARSVLLATHDSARSELEPLRAACRREPALRRLATHLERAREQIALLGTLGEQFASLAIEHQRDVTSLREVWDELSSEVVPAGTRTARPRPRPALDRPARETA